MAPRAATGPRRALHALVAAPDVDHLAELAFRVARLGVTVSSAADRAEVWCAMHERPPDLAVLAASLALAHEGDLLRRLARLVDAAHTPFVLVHDERATPRHASTAPPDGMLVHRCAWDGLEPTLRRVLAAAERRAPEPGTLHDAPIAVDGAIDTVAVRGTRVRVSSAELAMLRLLLRAPRGVSDAEIHARVWGGRPTRRDRALVSLVSRLRRKLVPLGVRLERAPVVRGYLLRW